MRGRRTLNSAATVAPVVTRPASTRLLERLREPFLGVEDVLLETGDAVAVSEARGLGIVGVRSAEVMLFDLP